MKKQILLLALILSTATTIAENPLSLEIPVGESNFTISEYFSPIYVSQLIEENPKIQSVTVKKFGQEFGYLNTLGGIGTNFLIEPEKSYEIYTNETITIILKN